MTPDSNRIASARLVLPLPRWPTSATLRIRSGALCGMPRTYRFRLTAVKRDLQADHGLGVELRDARLGHAEDLADLAQGQVLVVVEGDHEPLALGQRLDRVGEPVLELGRLRLGLGVDGARVLDRVEDRDLAAALGVGERPEVVEREHRGVGDLEQDALELLDA